MITRNHDAPPERMWQMIPGEDANEVADDADDVYGMTRTMLPGEGADDVHTRSFMLKMIGDIGV